MNILILSPFFSPNIGGVETHLDDLCSFLSSRCHVVNVITYQPLTSRTRAPRRETKGNVVVHRLQWLDCTAFLVSNRFLSAQLLLLSPGLFLATLVFLLRNFNKVDLIHSHGFIAGSIANVLSVIFRKPYVVSIHWVIGRGRLVGSKTLLNRLLSRARVVLTVSRAATKEMAASGFPREKLRRFKYWIDLSRFQPMDKISSKRTVKVEGQIFILFVGRLIPEKGVIILLEVARLFQRRADVRFGIIGTGPLETEIRKFCRLHTNVTYFGSLPNDRLPTYYNSADIVLVPSVREEGFGRVVVEALSCGTPVLASNKGGILEAMDETVGVLCDPDVPSIVAKLDLLLNNPGFLESLARRCRDFSVSRYGSENGLTIEQIYGVACKVPTERSTR